MNQSETLETICSDLEYASDDLNRAIREFILNDANFPNYLNLRDRRIFANQRELIRSLDTAHLALLLSSL